MVALKRDEEKAAQQHDFKKAEDLKKKIEAWDALTVAEAQQQLASGKDPA